MRCTNSIHCDLIFSPLSLPDFNDGEQPMNALIRVTLALAAGVAVCPAFAADLPAKLPAEAAAAHAAASTKLMARMADKTRTPAAKAGDGTAVIKTTSPGPRGANAFRAYPPSCAADPLPTDPTGNPVYTADIPLYTRDFAGAAYTPEVVTVYIWRVPCSSSGNLAPYNTDGLENAMVLMRIDRPGANPSTSIFPTFPSITSNQGSSTGNLVRSAVEPNTVISEAAYDTPILFKSTYYVLENYPYDGYGYTYFNSAFDLFIDPYLDDACTGCTTFNVGDYVPTPTNYPTAFQDLPIDGYMSATWYDTAHSGEGMLIQVIDSGATSRTLFAAWYTYDGLGLPFWITAQGTFTVGANSVNATGYYQTGGGFAGDFGSGTTQHTWGSVNFSFPNCYQMDFSYNGAASDVPSGPAGSGSRTWTRLADTNGLWCE